MTTTNNTASNITFRVIPDIYFDAETADALFVTDTGNRNTEYIAQFGGYYVISYLDQLFDRMVAYDLPAFDSREKAQAFADKRKDQNWSARFDRVFSLV